MYTHIHFDFIKDQKVNYMIQTLAHQRVVLSWLRKIGFAVNIIYQ